MRYLFLTYYTQPTGKIDEAITISNRIRTRDYQTVNLILDFKEQQVVKSNINNETIPKDWDRIVGYYYQYYPAIMERLFKENGHKLDIKAETPIG